MRGERDAFISRSKDGFSRVWPRLYRCGRERSALRPSSGYCFQFICRNRNSGCCSRTLGAVWIDAAGRRTKTLALTRKLATVWMGSNNLARPKPSNLSRSIHHQFIGEARAADSSAKILACRSLAGRTGARSKQPDSEREQRPVCQALEQRTDTISISYLILRKRDMDGKLVLIQYIGAII